MQYINKMCPLGQDICIMCLNDCPSSGEILTQYSVRNLYDDLNLTIPMGALPVENGAVMKCPLCHPYMTVSQK